MRLVEVGEQIYPECRGALGDLAGDVQSRLDIAERIMRIARCQPVQGRNAAQLDAHLRRP